MQDIIIERLMEWFRSLDFHFSRKGENYIFICEGLGIHVNAISQEEFFVALTNQILLTIIEKISNQVSKEPKKEEKTEQPKPSAKEQEKPFDVENWIREELKKEFQHEKLVPRENSHEHFQKIIREQQTPINPLNPFQNWPNPFPWNQVICLVG